MVFGTMITKMMTVANGANGVYDMSGLVSSEKRVLITPESGGIFHLLLTPASSSNNADAEDFLIPAGGIDIEVGRALDRVSIYNATGSQKKLYIAILS